MSSASVDRSAGCEDSVLVDRACAGDEAAFAALLGRHHAATIRVARAYVKSDAGAEEVAQEAWLAVLQGLDQFEGRASFKTWLFRIVANIAKRRAQKDARSVPFSALAGPDDDDAPSVDPARFQGAANPRWSGHWGQPPARWHELPEERLSSIETHALVEAAMAALPKMQRQVMVLRDVQECTSEETCAILGITEANQRVLLHRARSKVRQFLENALGGAR